LTHDEVVRWFRRFKHDPAFRNERGARTVPIANLAEWAGIPRANLYEILRGKLGISRNYHDRLVAAIDAVKAGLRWQRKGGRWQVTDPSFERLPRHVHPYPRNGRLADRREAQS